MTRSGTGSVHGRPSPLKAAVRTHKVRAALLSALALALTIGIILAVSGWGGTTTTTTSARHRAGPTFILPQTTVVTKGAKWLTGPAGKLLAAVNADIGRLSTAETAGKQGAAEIAGTQLAGDAKAALDGPMPSAAATVYQSALKDFVTAGTFAASGDFSKAKRLSQVGMIGITEVTAAADRPSKKQIGTAANEGAGQ